jgi:hypothetical protein
VCCLAFVYRPTCFGVCTLFNHARLSPGGYVLLLCTCVLCTLLHLYGYAIQPCII